MDRRLADARRDGFGEGDPGWAPFEVGKSALLDAHQLADSPEGTHSALLLYRSAVLLLADAHRARAAPAPDSGTPASDPWGALVELPQARTLVEKLTNEERALVEPALGGTTGEAHLAGLASKERRTSLLALRALAQGLAEPLAVKANRVTRLFRQRRLRRLAVVAIPLSLGLWQLVKLVPRPNLALHKLVSVTSLLPESGYAPRQLVDGDRDKVGFHSENRPDQSATIDLGTVERIVRVDVYNRTDCCRERAVPIRLEISTDGERYTHLATRVTPFVLWRAAFPEVSTRFVRVTREGAGYFHLAEVEVY